MPQYTVTEPHPTVAANAYTHSGRGGAGNMFRVAQTTAASGVPTPATTAASSTRFYSGRGGAGNAHSSAERHTLSFEEEYTSAAARDKSQHAGHVGRGGAGNVFAGDKDGSSHRRDSASTSGSVRSGFWGRLSGQH